MAISYEPGEEIKLNVESNGRTFYAKALSWRDQKIFKGHVNSLKDLETDEEQTEAALKLICNSVTKTDPAMEVTPETLEAVIDYRLIWGLVTALEFNLTADDKKKCELQP